MSAPRALAFAGTAKRARAISERLNAQGAPCIGLSEENMAISLARDGGIDVAILDLCSLRGPWAASFASDLRAAARSGRLAIVGLGALGAASPGLTALSALDGLALEATGWAGVVDVLKRSARLTLMEEAVSLRNLPSVARASRKPGALFVGPPSDRYLPLEQALARRGVVLRAVLSSFSAFDHIHEGIVDGIIIHIGERPEGGLALSSALRRNPRLKAMPIAVVAGPGFVDLRPANARQVEDALTGGVQDEAALDRFVAAMRWKEREDIVRALLQTPPDKAAADPSTHAFNREGFAQSYARIARQARLARRPLALTLARLRPAEARAHPQDVASLAGDQAVALLRRLVRGHDVLARLSRDVIAVVWMGAKRRDAEIGVARLSAVLEATTFGARANAALRLETATAALAPDENASHLLHRAAETLASLEQA